MSVSFQVQPRGKPLPKLPTEITISSLSANSSELYQQIAKATGKSVNRLRITKGSDGSHVAPKSTIESTGLRNRSVIAVKDLGPQIAWRTLFVIEYLGPLVIHPLIFYLRPWLYSNPNASALALGSSAAFPPPSPVQTLVLYMVVLHFAKRELETFLVHRFSNASMPASKILLNSAHYWLLAGANAAYWVYAPTSAAAATQRAPDSPAVTIGLGYYLIGELGNLYTHIVLRNLRQPGTTTRQIPRGWLFELVTCPNYMFEILAWVGVCLVSWSWSVVLFTAVATVPMVLWGIKKEKRYRREFGDKYKPKSATVIPGII